MTTGAGIRSVVGLGRLLTCAVCGGYKVEHGDDDRDMRPVSVV